MTAISQDRLFMLILVLLVFSAVHLLSPVLSPFVIGIFLAYLANTLVNQLTRLHLSRTLSVTIVFLVLCGAIVLGLLTLVPFIQKQVNMFIETLPRVMDWAQTTAMPWLSDNLNIDATALDVAAVKSLILNNWTKASGTTAIILQSIFQSGAKALAWLVDLFLIPVVAFYFMCDWYMIVHKARDLFPKRLKPTVIRLVTECDEVLSQFLRGQLLVMLSLGIIYALGLSLMGLQMGLLIGVIAGLLSIIPYLGFMVGIVVASITAFMQFGNATSVLLVCAVFIGGQTFDHFILTPKLVGNRIGLHPVAVIFAILAGSCLFGFVGALLALPAAAVLMVWARYWHHQLVSV